VTLSVFQYPADEQLLTGATGSLGVHLLHRLCASRLAKESKIICLVRAKDDETARSRILDVVSARGLQIDESRLVALAADVTKDNLGLSASVYDGLVKTVETLIHVRLIYLVVLG
jgi:L-aminoadipate-semialdehyde dehydrogenase